MRTIKSFFVAAAIAFAMGANAQLFSGGHVTANFNIGSVAESAGFGLGIGYQTKPFYTGDVVSLAWDVASFEWDAPFDSPKYLDQLSLKTGIRAFSPSFCKDKLRVYSNLAIGYTCTLLKGFDYSDFSVDWDDFYKDVANGRAGADDWMNYVDGGDFSEKMKGYSAFGLSWGIGIQYNEKISLGYTLQWESKFKAKNHVATISYTF